ncbi:cytochrome P450 [Mycena sanguinolenta]|nr:cytochrome P450 [Mycena sanguinolenta]
MISQILLPIGATIVGVGILHLLQFFYRELTSPLRHMVGPRSRSFVLGNFKEMADDMSLTSQWRSEFGSNFRFRGLFSMSELHSSDIKAINHIVANSSIYQRPPFVRDFVRRFLSSGTATLLLGPSHQSEPIPGIPGQNQAFGVAQIRLLTEVFVERSVQLRDIWTHQVAQENGAARIDVLEWLRRITLDVIGQAGFNYQFNEVFTDLLHSPSSQRYRRFSLAQSMLPILKPLPVPGGQLLKTARTKIDSIGSQIVSTSKAGLKVSDREKELGGKRDLLSVLLKSNLSPNVPESHRMGDAEVLAQIPSFLFAGHETTRFIASILICSSVSWALHALSLRPDVQSKLREEFLTLSTENPTMDELNSLPYLEGIVRETMRIHAPVVHTQRMAMADDVLPLSKPYTDKQGKSHESLPISKGQMIHIPILAVNTDKEIWGDDALEFKPERWEHIPEAASLIPGVWGNLLTFFGGATNCIRFRFSLVEMKALLFILIRAFEFEQAAAKVWSTDRSNWLRRAPRALDCP